MTPETRILIHALHNLLTDLELTLAPGHDEVAFAELKRIVHRRIEYLENDGRILSASAPGEGTGGD